MTRGVGAFMGKGAVILYKQKDPRRSFAGVSLPSPQWVRGRGGVHPTLCFWFKGSPAPKCIFRGIRPVIPTTSGHLNRGIRPALFSGFEAWVFWLSVLGVFVTCFEVGFSHALAV